MGIITIAQIKAGVCSHYGIERRHIDSTSRKYAHPRQMAMHLSRMMTTRSLPYIGSQFGRHHTTVLHAILKIKADPERMEEAKMLADMLGIERTALASQVKAEIEACRAVAQFARDLYAHRRCQCTSCAALVG